MSTPDVDLSQGDSPETEASRGDRAAEPGTPTLVVTECELADGPEKVWRALTVPKLLAGWLPEAVQSEILEAEPNRLLRYRWRGDEHDRDGAGQPLESVVSFELTDTDSGGTHLRVIHEPVAEQERPAHQGGSTVVPLVPRRKAPVAMAGIQTILRRAA